MGTLEAGSLEVGTSYGVGLESLSGFLWSVLAGGNKKKKKGHCRQSSSADPSGTAQGVGQCHCQMPSGHICLDC